MFTKRQLALGNASWIAITGLLLWGVAKGVDAQETFLFHDTFNDGDITNRSEGGVWTMGGTAQWFSASSGDLEVHTNDFQLVTLHSFDGTRVDPQEDWSFRARMTVVEPGFVGVGTEGLHHAALVLSGNDSAPHLRGGRSSSNQLLPIGYPFVSEEVMLQMDLFDGEVTAHVWKVGEYSDTYFRVQNVQDELPVRPAFGVTGHAIFHEAWVSSIPLVVPEPSSAILGVLTLAVMGVTRRQSRTLPSEM